MRPIACAGWCQCAVRHALCGMSREAHCQHKKWCVARLAPGGMLHSAHEAIHPAACIETAGPRRGAPRRPSPRISWGPLSSSSFFFVVWLNCWGVVWRCRQFRATPCISSHYSSRYHWSEAVDRRSCATARQLRYAWWGGYRHTASWGGGSMPGWWGGDRCATGDGLPTIAPRLQG